MKKTIKIGLTVLSITIGLFLNKAFGQSQVPFKSPPDVLSKLVLKKEEPTPFFSPDGRWVLICGSDEYVSIAELSKPQKILAGATILTKSFSIPVKQYSEMYLIDINTNKKWNISGLPKDLQASNIKWNYKGSKVAFTQKGDTSVDLFVVNLSSKSAMQTNKERLNLVMGTTYQWTSDDFLVYKTIDKANKLPVIPDKDVFPVIYQSDQKAPNPSSSSGLLQTDTDDQLFQYYVTSQLVVNKNGREHKIGIPQMYADFQVSPNQRYVLSIIFQTPFSRKVKHHQFARSVEVMDLSGRKINQVAVLSNIEQQNSRDNVGNQGRQFSWAYNKPASVYWLQPPDSNSMEKAVEYDDALYSLDMVSAKKEILFKTKNKIKDLYWINDSLSLVEERNVKGNIEVFSLLNWRTSKSQGLYTQKITGENRIGIPAVLKSNNNQVQTAGSNRIVIESLLQRIPSVLAMNAKGELDTLWKYNALNTKSQYFGFLNSKQLLITREKLEDSIIYCFFPSNSSNTSINRISVSSYFTNPLAKTTHQTINYTRDDDVLLAGNLYLPEKYDIKKNGALPIMIWGYPVKYDSIRVYKPNPETSKKIGPLVIDIWESPVIWTLAGYAVIKVDMPILGGKFANEAYLKQIILNAKAAIDKLVDMGIGDRSRVVVGGHSYGASMVANLLAHTNYFKAGIAMSGAYNRINTPFGFQEERRSFWEAQPMYDLNSPIRYADKIKTPLLLVHGENDQGAGTPVTESINLFKAIEKNGGTVKLLVLKNEEHVYLAKENILHLFAEQLDWLQKYVNNTVPIN